MPLHLLSKKSWNVYSPANRARVARDEALAEAAARDAERKRNDEESDRRIRLLQQRAGEEQKQIGRPDARSHDRTDADRDALLLAATQGLGKARNDGGKRRRLAGEDDTDRDIRYAKRGRETNGGGGGEGELGLVKLRATKGEEMEAPIVDSKGNINLFPVSQPKPGRKSEMEMEKAKQKAMEENSAMRLADALGRNSRKKTWYLDTDGAVKDAVGQDVWGNEDPRRLQREARRVVQADPLAFMKQAQGRLKEVQLERKERELALKWSRSREDMELEDFSLDAPDRGREDSKRRDHRRRHERDKSRERSQRDSGPERKRKRRQSRSYDDKKKERRHHDRERSRSPR